MTDQRLARRRHICYVDFVVVMLGIVAEIAVILGDVVNALNSIFVLSASSLSDEVAYSSLS